MQFSDNKEKKKIEKRQSKENFSPQNFMERSAALPAFGHHLDSPGNVFPPKSPTTPSTSKSSPQHQSIIGNNSHYRPGLMSGVGLSESNGLLPPHEDVEKYFKSLDRSSVAAAAAMLHTTPPYHPSTPTAGSSVVGGSVSTGVTSSYLLNSNSTTNPVYVPTTRPPMLPTGLAGYTPQSTAHTPGRHSTSSPIGSTWPLGTDHNTAAALQGYSTPTTHPSISSRFTFPPTPNSPTGRASDTASSYMGSSLASSSGTSASALNPYTAYMSADVTSPWNSYNLGFGSPGQGMTRFGGELF